LLYNTRLLVVTMIFVHTLKIQDGTAPDTN
jgi:hypothetical protein